MDDGSELQEVEQRLEVVERRSHHILLIGIAAAGMATAAWLVWRARRRAAASTASRARRKRPGLRAVPGSGRSSPRGAATKKPSHRRKRTD